MYSEAVFTGFANNSDADKLCICRGEVNQSGPNKARQYIVTHTPQMSWSRKFNCRNMCIVFIRQVDE